MTFQLQDFDKVVHGNLSAGLLCEPDFVGAYKTRVVSEWLEQRGFDTRICERAFDGTTRRHASEPAIALCGFDSAEARQHIENAGFDLIIECGIGASLDDFDSLLLHTFPDASKSPVDLWGAKMRLQERAASSFLIKAFSKDGDCGILAATLAQKPVSTSFVGAYAGALMIGEVLRGLHDGVRMELLSAQMRADENIVGSQRPENYVHRFARNGFLFADQLRNPDATDSRGSLQIATDFP